MSAEPVVTTGRFGLWRPRVGDLDAMCRLIADEETRRYLGPADPRPPAQWERLVRNAGSWSLYGYGVFYVRPHGSEEIVASCGVFHSWRGLDPRMDDQPEAGWVVRRDWCGQGVAGEAMTAALDWFAAAHGPARVVAMIERGNLGSERLAARLGFRAFGEVVEAEGTVLDLYERVAP